MTFADRAGTERAYLSWLGRTLVGVAERPSVTRRRPARHPARRPLHLRRRDRDGPRAARRRLAREGGGRHPRRHRHHAVVGRRDRRPVPAQPRAVPDVARGPLADARHAVRTTLLDEVHRLLSKAYPLDPSLAYPWRAWAELVETPASTTRWPARSSSGPSREPDDASADRLPPRARHDPPRGLGARDPRLVRRAPDGGGMVGRRRRPEHHAGRDRDRDRGRGDGRPGVHRAVRRRPRAGRHRPSRGPGHRPRDAVDRRELGLEVGVLDGYSAVVGSGAAIRIVFDDPSDWQWALDTWRSLAPG